MRVIGVVVLCCLLNVALSHRFHDSYKYAEPDRMSFIRTPKAGQQFWERGDQPPSFSIETLGSPYSFVPNSQESVSNPTVFFAWNQTNEFQNAMLFHDFYLEKLFQISPTNIQYVFLSYYNPYESAIFMQDRCFAVLASLNLTKSQIDEWKERLYFSIETVESIASGDYFISSLLHQWTGSNTWMKVQSNNFVSNIPDR